MLELWRSFLLALVPRALVPRALALAAALAVPLPAAAAGFVRDAEIEHVLAKLSNPIFRAAGIAPDSVNIMILDQPAPNAFVFAGRNMVFSTGMLRRYAKPDELRGVIAHETGHITGGHLEGKQTFQPMNVNFGLFPDIAEFPKTDENGKRLRGKAKGRAKKGAQAARALSDIDAWLAGQSLVAAE